MRPVNPFLHAFPPVKSPESAQAAGRAFPSPDAYYIYNAGGGKAYLMRSMDPLVQRGLDNLRGHLERLGYEVHPLDEIPSTPPSWAHRVVP